MKHRRRWIALLLALVIQTGLIGMAETNEVYAAVKPAQPEISLSETDNYGEVLVTISETKNADGYRIYCKSNKDKSYRKLDTIEKDGTKKRKYIAEGLASGLYSFRVKAYSKASGKTVWSGYSRIVKIDVIDAATRALNDLMNETASDKYPELYELVEKGLLGLTMSQDNQIYFTLGSFDMINGNGNYDGKKDTLEWIVIDYDEEEGKALLLSRYAIDKKSYNDTMSDITWETCTLRNWLNGDFYGNAFNASEQKMILFSEVRNQDKSTSGVSGGNDTKEKIFLLSYEETRDGEYFINATDRKATLYDGTSCWWWLRSPGSSSDCAAYVYSNGDVRSMDVYRNYVAVRPALWINLNP